MDQEVSRSTWIGSSLLALVASIALALVIYGIARTISIGYIDNLAKTFLDANYGELVELHDATTPLTKSAVVGLVERNKTTIKKVTITKENGSITTLPNSLLDLTPLNLHDELTKAGQYTSYNTHVEVNMELGTVELKIYVNK